MKANNYPIPNGNYVGLATPLDVDDVKGDKGAAVKHLDYVSTVLCAHAGTNLLHSIVLEGVVNADTSALTLSTEAIEVPRLCDGPFFYSQNWTDAADILDAISGAPEKQAGRIRLALEFLGRAMWHVDPFFFYWCSLEILCGGHSGRIADKLRSCYGFKNHADAQDGTGFRTLRNMRDRYFHFGSHVSLTQDVERYIQLLFLDLLRADLKLSTQNHAVAMVMSGNFNLAQLRIESRGKEAADETE